MSESLSEDTEEGIDGVVLTTLEDIRMWKRIAFVGNRCLRGKV